MQKPVGLVVFLAATTSLFAQSLTEKIDVSLVNVDVTVTSHGAPARGLTRDDFEVFEDGVARPITNFYSVEPAAMTASTAPTVTTPDATLADPTDDRFRRKVLVIIDNRHVSMFRRDLALAALERFVDDRFTGGTYDWSIALVSDKAHLMLPLTSDKEKLHATIAAVRRIVTNPDRPSAEDLSLVAPVGGFDSRNVTSMRTTAPEPNPSSGSREALRSVVDFGTTVQRAADATQTVAAIRDAVRSFAGAPGRKIILLVTGSLGLDDGSSTLEANPVSIFGGPAAMSQSARFGTQLRDVLIHEANTSNVSFFIVNSEGLSTSVDVANGSFDSSFNSSMASGNPNQLASMYWLARETGGRLMPGNSADLSLAEFDKASSSFYSLAYKPAHGEDGKYHTIKVRMKQSGYELHYRTGYSSVPAGVQLARAMQSPLAPTMQQSSIPIDFVTGKSVPHDGGVLVPLSATVPAKSLQFLPVGKESVARVDLYVSVFNDRGDRITTNHFVGEARAANGTESAGNFVDTRQLLIKRGVPYRVVVAVHDQTTDAIGITSRMVRF
jgi:VWFA-related protein